MKIHTIDYKKTYGEHCVYTQTITIDKELKKSYNNRINYLKRKINKKIEKEHTYTYDEGKILSFTKTLKNGINYLKLTGLYEFNLLAFKKGLDYNRLKFNRNTIIIVK